MKCISVACFIIILLNYSVDACKPSCTCTCCACSIDYCKLELVTNTYNIEHIRGGVMQTLENIKPNVYGCKGRDDGAWCKICPAKHMKCAGKCLHGSCKSKY